MNSPQCCSRSSSGALIGLYLHNFLDFAKGWSFKCRIFVNRVCSVVQIACSPQKSINQGLKLTLIEIGYEFEVEGAWRSQNLSAFFKMLLDNSYSDWV